MWLSAFSWGSFWCSMEKLNALHCSWKLALCSNRTNLFPGAFPIRSTDFKGKAPNTRLGKWDSPSKHLAVHHLEVCRAVFIWVLKRNWFYFVYINKIGLKSFCYFSSSLEVKSRPIAPRSHLFAHALRQLLIGSWGIDWFFGLSVTIVIGQNDCDRVNWGVNIEV